MNDTHPKVAGTAGSRIRGALVEGLGLRKHPPSLADQLGSDASEPHLASRSVEEHHAQFGLQVLNLLAEGRLRHVQARGCSAETELVCDGHEVTQVPEFHSGTIHLVYQ